MNALKRLTLVALGGALSVALFPGCGDPVAPGPPAGDVLSTDAAGQTVPAPPTCLNGPWWLQRLDDGGTPRWMCVPNFPIWGDAPDAPSGLKLSDDGVLLDPLTKLEWQAVPAQELYSWQQAAVACDNLVLGGKQDWRPPTFAELFSLVDLTTSEPALPAALPSKQGAATYWTAIGRGDVGWTVEFSFGQAKLQPKHLQAHVRCVRSEAWPTGAAAERFSFYGNDITADTLLGLQWTRLGLPNTYTFTSAIGWCSKLDLSGGGWRLPTERQLVSLMDHRGLPWPIEATVFAGPVGMEWSSTIQVPSQPYAWSVDFESGGVAAQDFFAYAGHHCVRDLK